MAKDSLYIFIETTVDIKDETVNQLLYTDILQFGQGSNSQQIPLVTLVQDAILLFPESSSDGQKQSVVIGFDNNGNEILSPGFELKTEQLRFTNEKPYIIYGFAVVPKEQKLVIDAGARVLVDADITANKNMVPFDDKSPFITSVIRFGTAAITTRGLKEADMSVIVDLVDEVLTNAEDEAKIADVKKKVNALMSGRELFNA